MVWSDMGRRIIGFDASSPRKIKPHFETGSHIPNIDKNLIYLNLSPFHMQRSRTHSFLWRLGRLILATISWWRNGGVRGSMWWAQIYGQRSSWVPGGLRHWGCWVLGVWLENRPLSTATVWSVSSHCWQLKWGGSIDCIQCLGKKIHLCVPNPTPCWGEM